MHRVRTAVVGWPTLGEIRLTSLFVSGEINALLTAAFTTAFSLSILLIVVAKWSRKFGGRAGKIISAAAVVFVGIGSPALMGFSQLLHLLIACELL